MVSALFGSTTLSRLASLLLAAPIVFILCLVTLATSNIVFSVLYSRRQQQQQEKQQQQNASTKTATSTRQPGQAHRHAFHSLRPAYFSRPVAWSAIEKRRKQEQAAKYRTPIADTMPQLSEAIDTVIELILRDYVTGWMRAITVETVIQQRIEELLRMVLLKLKQRVMHLDLTQLMVMDLVPKITSHVNDFRKAEMHLRGNRLERKLTASDELDLLVASQFRQGKLHRAISSTSTSTVASEEAYLRVIVQAVLPTLIPPNEAHSLVLSTLLREILVGAVLRPVMEILSDPDYWNQNVDLYAGKAIREQNMVKKLREALKQHADSLDYDPKGLAPSQGGEGAGETRDVHGKGDLHSFEDFLKMIKRCDSLLDVKRIRNTIMIQIRKKKTLIAGRERDEIVNGSKVEDTIVYINKLDIAKRHAEKRIEALGGPAYSKRRTKEYTPSIRGASSAINLETVLTNPTGLSYFMEFQDRRNIMNELQFWLLIESLNIKAETHDMSDASLDSQSRESKSDSIKTGAVSYKSTAALPPSMPPTPSTIASNKEGQGVGSEQEPSTMTTTTETSDTLREDVRMIYEMYFAEAAPRRVRVDPAVIETIRAYGFVPSPSPNDPSTTTTPNTKVSSTRSAASVPLQEESNGAAAAAAAAVVRQYLLHAQKQVFELMLTRDYPEFSKSDLYYKFVASYQALLAESREGGGSQDGYDHHDLHSHHHHHHPQQHQHYPHSEPTTPIAQRTQPPLPTPLPPPPPPPPPPPAVSQHPHRSSLLSALNLGSPERRRETRNSADPSMSNTTGTTTKRSSTGSFLEIFGIGREKDRERERERERTAFFDEHGPAALRRALLSVAPPSITKTASSLSSAVPAAVVPSSSADHSSRGGVGGSSNNNSSMTNPKSSTEETATNGLLPPPPPRGRLQPAAPIPSVVAAVAAAPLSRSRSMGSLKGVEEGSENSSTCSGSGSGSSSSRRKLSVRAERSSTMMSGDDPRDPPAGHASTSGTGDGGAAAPRLSDSLLLELERQGTKLTADGYDDDEELEGGKFPAGVAARIANRKPSGIDAVEAALSSILQTEGQHDDDDDNRRRRQDQDHHRHSSRKSGSTNNKPGGPQAIKGGRGEGEEAVQDGSNTMMTTPSFATATEDSHLMRWGSTRSKRKKNSLRIVTPDDEAAAAASTAAAVSQGSVNVKEPTVVVSTTSTKGSSSRSPKTDDRVIRIKPRSPGSGDRPRSSLTASLEFHHQQPLQTLLEQEQEQAPSSPVEHDGVGSQESPTAAMSPGPFSATEPEGDDDSESESDSEEDMPGGGGDRRRSRSRRRREDEENVHRAAPGDLLLATRIQKLRLDIENVKKQEQIVEALMQKAERQGRQNQLWILKKSKSALRREIHSMEYQKTQYEVQEAENMIMPGRSTLSITSSTVGHDGSKEFALYVIEVHQMAQDGSFASGWVIARRYSEFFALHQVLKEKFPMVKQFELPGKRGFLKLQKSFVESRRIGLERYLRQLIRHEDICQSQELRSFLSQENIALPQFSSTSSSSNASTSSLLLAATASLPSVTLPSSPSASSSTAAAAGVAPSTSVLGPSLFGNDSTRQQEPSSASTDSTPRASGHGRSMTQSQSGSSSFSFEQLFHSNPLSNASANHHSSKEHAARGGGGGGTGAGVGVGDGGVRGSEVGSRGVVSLDLDRGTRGGGGGGGGGAGEGAESGFMKHIYQTVSEGIDDMFSGGPPTVLGNITKQLGNQMMQFSLESDDHDDDRRRQQQQQQTANGIHRRLHFSTNGPSNRRSHDGGGGGGVATATTMTPGAVSSSSSSRPTNLGRQRSLTDSRVYSQAKLEGQPHLLPLMTVAGLGSVGGGSGSSSNNYNNGQGGHGPAAAAGGSTMAAVESVTAGAGVGAAAAAATVGAATSTTTATIVETMNVQGQPTMTVVGEEAEGVTTFTEPLCDLFIELFELKEKNNWLRRQAVVIILQQVLGGTIERKLRDMIKAYVEESMLTFYVCKLRDTLWPPPSPPPSSVVVEEGYEVVGREWTTMGGGNGAAAAAAAATAAMDSATLPQKAKPRVPRTPEQKTLTRDQASRKLSEFLPDLLGNMVGHQNARRGARRLFAAFQNRRLNQQLVYTALDEVVAALWPELVVSVDQCGIHLKQPSSTPKAKD
ncbi:Intermediate filament protein [Actinomortierella ambigua]|uniref:Intermediate filament protein n=1 Tax=Actinomortierella ambigua TaxID=1343610 RepID=A0A9P6Q8J9_9FUNG|nr:Intermediate filament protein [Actinomortierella ambigua]